MKRSLLLLIPLLVFTAAPYAAVTHWYFYPAGAKPAGMPPDSATVTNLALATWQQVQVDGNAPTIAFGGDEAGHAETNYAGRQPALLLVSVSNAYSYLPTAPVGAWLYLYLFGGANSNPTVGIDVARIASAWSESTVTWGSGPSYSGNATGFSPSQPGLNNTISVDVYNAVNAEYGDTPANRRGFALKDTQAESPYFFAKETPVAAYRPFLLVIVPEPGALLALFAVVMARCELRRMRDACRT